MACRRTGLHSFLMSAEAVLTDMKPSSFQFCSRDSPLSFHCTWMEAKAMLAGMVIFSFLVPGEVQHQLYMGFESERGGPWALSRLLHDISWMYPILNCCFFTWKVPQCSLSGTTDHGLLLKDNLTNRCGTRWQILLSIKCNTNMPCPKLRLKCWNNRICIWRNSWWHKLSPTFNTFNKLCRHLQWPLFHRPFTLHLQRHQLPQQSPNQHPHHLPSTPTRWSRNCVMSSRTTWPQLFVNFKKNRRRRMNHFHNHQAKFKHLFHFHSLLQVLCKSILQQILLLFQLQFHQLNPKLHQPLHFQVHPFVALVLVPFSGHHQNGVDKKPAL